VAWGAIVWGLWALYSTWQARRAWFALMRQDYTLAELETVAAALQAQAEADAKGSEEIAKAEEAARREAERKAEREAQPPPTTPLGKLTRWIG
jgi:hypothetical protein